MYFRLILKHTGCWSNLLEKYSGVYGELISQKIKKNKYIEAHVIFKKIEDDYRGNQKNKIRTFNEFFNNLKNQPDIISFEKVESMKAGNVYLIKLLAKRKNSISELIEQHNPPYFRETFYQGLEIWYVFSWFEDTRKIIEDIEKKSRIIRFDKLEYNEFETVITKIDASQNLRLLNEIYSSGYYSLKKASSLGELAKNYNISKSNLSRKLKSIEINAVSYYLKSHMPTHSLDNYILERRERNEN